MTLEDAKEILKVTINAYENEDEFKTQYDVSKTVLNYIENESIPKEKVKEAINYEKEQSYEPDGCGFSATALHGYTVMVLEKLLEK